LDSEYQERQKANGIKYSWEYSGNNYGWWLYDDRANTLIEQHYQLFLEAYRTIGLTPAQFKKARKLAMLAGRSPRPPQVLHQPVVVPLVMPPAPVAAVDPTAVPTAGVPPAISLAAIADGSAPLPANPHATFRLQIANSSYNIDFTRMVQESVHDATKYVHTSFSCFPLLIL
jgi:hypothetical protein